MASKKGSVDTSDIRKIRITLSSTNHTAVENVSAELLRNAKAEELKVKGPIRLPTKVLRITTRKSPCGNGTNTWDKFEMRIHKRIIDLHSPSDIVRQLTSISLEPGVDFEVSLI